MTAAGLPCRSTWSEAPMLNAVQSLGLGSACLAGSLRGGGAASSCGACSGGDNGGSGSGLTAGPALDEAPPVFGGSTAGAGDWAAGATSAWVPSGLSNKGSVICLATLPGSRG